MAIRFFGGKTKMTCGPGDIILEEIETFRMIMNIPKDKTYIMPAGDNREQLIKMYPLVFNMCSEHGYNMTGRDHIIAFDTQRMV